MRHGPLQPGTLGFFLSPGATCFIIWGDDLDEKRPLRTGARVFGVGDVRRWVAAGVVGVVVAAGAVVGGAMPASAASGPAPIEQRNAATVTADPLPTVQIDSGIVWAQVISGDTVYAGGSFSNARPAGAAPGTGLMPRSNLLAYSISTGVATSFAPVIEGTVKSLAVSPDGSRLYVGGSFQKVNGQTRFNFAAFDTATGQLLASFKPAIGGSYVNAIVATNTTVYVGGLIGAAGGVTRKNLAAVSAAGAVLGWAPTTDLQVDAMVLAPGGGKLIVGGRFATVNGAPQRGLAALDLFNGAVLPWEAPATVKNGAGEGDGKGKAGIWALSADADAVYGTGWVFANKYVGNLEGIFAASGTSGAIKWIADCHGDHYGVYSDGTNVYSTGHEHDCVTAGGLPQAYPAPGNVRHATVYSAAAKGTLTTSPSVNNIYADWGGYPAPAAVNWYPDWTTGTASGQGQAGWTTTGNGQYMVVGGEFPFVNGQRSQGIARFSKTPTGGAKQAPRLSGTKWTPTAKSISAGTARVTIPANWDRDDLNLTYELWEQGGTQPVATATSQSTFWNTPPVALTVKNLLAGSAHTYRVIAKDADGNTATSANVAVTVSSAVPSAYADRVLEDGASVYWRLGGANGTLDWAGDNDATATAGVGTTADDALSNEDNGAATFDGSSSFARTTSTASVGTSFATEIWFKTDTTTGGKLTGYGDAANGTSSSYDRHLYMNNDGRLTFGVYPGRTATVQSSASYNDDEWHHAVAQQSAAGGIQLYVDGELVGSDPAVSGAQSYTGYWRIGGDNLNGWPGQPSTNSFDGSLDEFAVYGKTLTAAQVASHFAAGAGSAAPVARVVHTVDGLTARFDGTTSTASGDASIAGYAWTFGDGTTSTEPAPVHAYNAAGTYDVTLTVTDGAGGSSAPATSSVTVTHAAPIAAFTQQTSALSVSVDASGATATDGATLSYSWNWGDGSPATTGATSSHSFSADGTYSVTLTVTDSLGGSATSVQDAVVAGAATPDYVARDDFGRTVATGWGQAATGGSWGGAAGFSVAGGVGRITLSPGQTRTNALSAASAKDLDARLSVSANKLANGGGLHVNSVVRKSAAGEYRAKLRTLSTGAVTVALTKLVGTTETQLTTRTLTGYTFTAGSTLELRLQTVTEGNSTAIRAKVWASGAPEPSAWFVTANDAQAQLQSAGRMGVTAYLSGTTTNGPVIVSIDNLAVTGAAVAPPHAAPVAAFSSQVAGLGVSVDASTSTASDGATLTYSWNWGDGTPPSTGVTATHAYAAAGDRTITLTVTDSLGATAQISKTVTVAPAAHVAPVASFVPATSGLGVSVDGSGSSASDGASVSSYSWEWGDGSPASEGVTASHSYGAAGSFTVTLTVTDSQGASSSSSQVVSVSAESFVARDDFERVVPSGWSSALVGGAWSTAAGFSVAGGAGVMSLSPGQTRVNTLAGVSAQNVDARAVFGSDKVADGGGLHVNYVVRKSAAGEYRLKLRVGANGAVTVSAAKLVGGAETLLANRALSGYTHSAAARLQLRFQAVTAGGITTLQGKVWPDGSAEPSEWSVSTTDAQAELQGAGQVGVLGYLSGSTTNAPVSVTVDDLEIR